MCDVIQLMVLDHCHNTFNRIDNAGGFIASGIRRLRMVTIGNGPWSM